MAELSISQIIQESLLEESIGSAGNLAPAVSGSNLPAKGDKTKPEPKKRSWLRAQAERVGKSIKYHADKHPTAAKIAGGTVGTIAAGVAAKSLYNKYASKKSAPSTFLSKAADKVKSAGNKAAAFGKSKTGKMVAGGSLAAIGAGVAGKMILNHLKKKKKKD